LFETIIDNLLENATSFAPEGSKIAVALRADKNNAVLSVTDQGPGVPETDLERIFERYFSRRDEDARTGTNFGIGLWIVRRNAEAVGGTVRARRNAPSIIRPGCPVHFWTGSTCTWMCPLWPWRIWPYHPPPKVVPRLPRGLPQHVAFRRDDMPNMAFSPMRKPMVNCWNPSRGRTQTARPHSLRLQKS